MWNCNDASRTHCGAVASYGLGGGSCIGATIAQPLQPMRRALAPMVLSDITNTNSAIVAGKAAAGFLDVTKNVSVGSCANTLTTGFGGACCPLPQPPLATGDSVFRITSTVPATGSTC